MVWFQRFAQWMLTLFERILRIIAWIVAITLVLFILYLLVQWHADFLYDYFIRRLSEDFLSSEHPQEMMLRLIQTLSH